MTDTKRDFLYEFNRGLREVYSNNPSIVSVFENIDNGSLSFSPSGIPEAGFVKEVGKFIFMVKKIVADPYKVFKGKQEVVPVSQAQNVDHESVKLTLADTSVWSNEAGKRMPKQAYSLVKEYVFTNYENAFICQLINLLITKLKSVKSNNAFADKDSKEYVEFIETIDSYVRKLTRLSKERVFVENNRRVVDMSNVFLTDILMSDNRYCYCYKFFCDYLKSKGNKASFNRDFRVLYHNFALVQFLYRLHKSGYSVENANYYISVTGKMFIDTVVFSGAKNVTVLATKNGIDISSESKVYHVEFSKLLIKSSDDISKNCNSKVENLNKDSKYDNIYVAYLSSEEQLVENALSIGYGNAGEVIDKLINSL